jgi:membrane associated rhomboid family serine protease
MNKVLFAVGCVLIFVAGCTVLTTTDPNTGLSSTTYALDPNNAILATTETVAEVGVAVGGAIAPFLGGAAALIVSAWEARLRPGRRSSPA